GFHGTFSENDEHVGLQQSTQLAAFADCSRAENGLKQLFLQDVIDSISLNPLGPPLGKQLGLEQCPETRLVGINESRDGRFPLGSCCTSRVANDCGKDEEDETRSRSTRHSKINRSRHEEPQRMSCNLVPRGSAAPVKQGSHQANCTAVSKSKNSLERSTSTLQRSRRHCDGAGDIGELVRVLDLHHTVHAWMVSSGGL